MKFKYYIRAAIENNTHRIQADSNEVPNKTI